MQIDVRTQAVLDAVAAQRDAALNAHANAAGEIAVLRARIAELEAASTTAPSANTEPAAA